MATFEEAIATIPFTPSTEQGRGYLPPFMRAGGHLLYLLGRLSDTPTRRPTDNQVRSELDSLKLHFDNFIVPDYMSNRAKELTQNWRNAFDALDTEILGWEQDTRITNLQMLENRLMAVVSFMDREILGIQNSDPGNQL